MEIHEQIWLRQWLDAWAMIGWYARTDLFLRAYDRFALAAFNTSKDHQMQLDNIRVDVEKIKHKVRS